MPEKILRCAIYIRVSTFEQSVHGKSLQAQKECLEQYATDNNMSIVGVYADEGKTARKELKKRKAIHALVEDVKRDKIDVIIFWDSTDGFEIFLIFIRCKMCLMIMVFAGFPYQSPV